MERLIFLIDSFTSWSAKAFSWCILILTFGIAYEVMVRYLLRNPTSWAFDLSYMMYGTLFMMAGAYALSRDAHVRGDIFYRLWKPKRQALVELVLYILFFFPGVLALLIAGTDYSGESWTYNGGRGEVSTNSPADVPIFQFKTIIPLAAGLMLIQGVGQVMRCIICLKTGEWPAHLEDVEEMEEVLLHQHQEAEAAAANQAAEENK